MSTPFPLEEAAQTDDMRPTWNPWNGPAAPTWYAGLGFDEDGQFKPYGLVERGIYSGVAKGQAVLGGLLHQDTNITYDVDPSGSLTASEGDGPPDNTIADAIQADAREKIKRFTPDAATNGAAAQLLHGLVSGATEMLAGSALAGPAGAAAVVGSGEGYERYNELIDAGVAPETARTAAAITGVSSGVFAVIPAGVGQAIATKIATGAIGNTALGIASRYADHQILASAGYTQMAEQQKVLDGTQVLTDLILGAGFGGLAHLHETPEVKALQDAPGARDAALTTNLALKDRQAAPGIPTDPEAARAHQEALEKGIADLMQGKPVDVSQAGVTEAGFVERPQARDPEVVQAAKESVTQTALFGEENEREVQALLEGREIEPEAKPPQATEPEAAAAGDAAPRDALTREPKPEAPAAAQPAAGAEPAGETGQASADTAAHDQAQQILAAKPDLTIPDENGAPVNARDALAAANDEVATTTRESKIAAQAAITCYMRRGG